MGSRHELIGVYRGLTHQSCCWPNDDGTQTIIAKIELSDGTEQVVKGTIYPGQLVRGITYRFYGIERDYKGKPQFVFDSFVAEQPSNEESVVAYLTQCNGIGPAVARSLFQQYGGNAVAKLREHPEAAAESTPRLTREKALTASEYLKKFEMTEHSKMDLLGLLKGRGFPKNVVEKLLDDYGAEAGHVVKRNPYILMNYKGCGFKKTDDMYLSLGHNPSRIKRQALCAWHAIASQRGGHTWYPFHVVKNHLQQNISSTDIDIERALRLAVRGKLLSDKFFGGQRWIAEHVKDDDEAMIAKLVDEAAKEPWTGWPIMTPDECLSDHQKEILAIAAAGSIGVLGGRPGSGKSFTAARLVRRAIDTHGIQHIAVAAPTGKAAVRVTAAMESNGVSIRATTIHSLLGLFGDSVPVAYGRLNPLPFKLILIDEASMIDATIMRKLLEARAEGACILFCGDINQLAPVGHGAPLRDMISAGIPYGELTKIRRNSGRGVLACSEVVDSNRLTCSPKLDLPNGENLLLIERDTAESQIDTLAALMGRFQRDYMNGAADAADPIWDVQIIVPVNDKSKLGRKPLNKALQDLLNPDGRCAEGNPFRVGDKLINTKNGEYKAVVFEMEPDNSVDFDPFADKSTQPEKCYVANGEQAEVIDVDTTKIIARLTCPDRTIIVPRSSRKVSETGETADDDESTGSGCNWELGYAISGHKSQGSEWPVVIWMCDGYAGAKNVQSKQFVYTVLSRFKKMSFIIGDKKVAEACCTRDALFLRQTFLAERITQLNKRIVMTPEVSEMLLEGV